MKELIEGRMEGKRGKGKIRIMMLDGLKPDESYEKCRCPTIYREY